MAVTYSQYLMICLHKTANTDIIAYHYRTITNIPALKFTFERMFLGQLKIFGGVHFWNELSLETFIIHDFRVN
jgi:hypothetical protein